MSVKVDQPFCIWSWRKPRTRERERERERQRGVIGVFNGRGRVGLYRRPGRGPSCEGDRFWLAHSSGPSKPPSINSSCPLSWVVVV
jgi:hypothetical protein